jgi:hypothetical protein
MQPQAQLSVGLPTTSSRLARQLWIAPIVAGLAGVIAYYLVSPDRECCV